MSGGQIRAPTAGASHGELADEPVPARLADDAKVWLRIGCLSFGGPAGQIALLQRLLVDELRWISQRRFLAGLDLCMLLPGPEAQQLATYVGWTRQGWRGGVVAGSLFVLPGALVLLALSALYVSCGEAPAVAALFAGAQAAVVAIVAQALGRIARRSLNSPGAVGIALSAFGALALFAAPFPLVILGAAAGGLLLGGGSEPSGEPVRPAARGGASARLPALVAALLWVVPLGALVAGLGRESLLAKIALRFAELAVVSFGGAYALLAALAERAVADGWLAAEQMADGLALAETTPGPLILVLQFVAFVAASGAAGPGGLAAGGAAGWSALAAGAAASAVALWALFLPSFVWIFLAAPHLERLEASPHLRRAVRGVSAAVVGVILHLTLWFALHVLFEVVARRRVGPLELAVPDLASIDFVAVGLAVFSWLLLVVARQSVGRTMAAAALLALVLRTL